MTTPDEQNREDARHADDLASIERRHAVEMDTRRWEVSVHARLRAFEMVNPYALASLGDDEALGQALAVAELVALWAATGQVSE